MSKGVLVVSFGTTHADTREETIGNIEKDIKDKFKEYRIYRAFTSEMVRKSIWEIEKVKIPNVIEAMKEMLEDGIIEVMIQPTHIIPGIEYDKMVSQALKYKEKFQNFHIGTPLLQSKEDYIQVVEALMSDLKEKEISLEKGISLEKKISLQKGHAILFMGHGTKHKANENYRRLQEQFKEEGYENIYIATMEGTDDIYHTIDLMKQKEIFSVTLVPLMIAAGEHVKNDMAGNENDSWKTILAKSGYKVHCIMNGLGENRKIREILVNHLTSFAINKE